MSAPFPLLLPRFVVVRGQVSFHYPPPHLYFSHSCLTPQPLQIPGLCSFVSFRTGECSSSQVFFLFFFFPLTFPSSFSELLKETVVPFPHLHLQASTPWENLQVCFFASPPPHDSLIFVLPLAGEMLVLKFSPVPPGVMATFGVYCSGAAEAAVLPSLMASGWLCDLWEGGLISFHLCPRKALASWSSK